MPGVLTPTRTRLAIGVLLALVLSFYPVAWRLAAPAMSPFLAICAPLAVRSLGVVSLLALPMIIVVLLRRRFWCRRLCPVGLLSETCGRARGTRATAVRKSSGRRTSWPPARFIALATLAGAIGGYPLFLWMDPLAVFAGFFNVARVAQPGVPAVSAIALPLVLLISFLYPGQWCSRLCPLGGTQDLLALLAHRFRRTAPELRRYRAVQRHYPRRAFLAGGAAVLSCIAAARLWASKPRQLRPPGAVDEAAFQGGCIRCGSCTRVCPTQIIQPTVEPSEIAGFLVPHVQFRGTGYCRQDCNLCGQVCPTGVIRSLGVAEKNRHVIGLAVIDRPNCYLALEKECGICIARCPRAALVDVFDYRTYQASIEVRAANCNGCGACVGICPPKVIRVAVPPAN